MKRVDRTDMNRSPLRITAVWAGLALAAWVLSAGAPYTAPDGDLNRDGTVDALDLQCEVLLFDALMAAGQPEEDLCEADTDCPEGATCRPGPGGVALCLPECLSADVVISVEDGPACDNPEEVSDACLGTVPRPIADMDCDQTLTSADFVFLVAVITNHIGGAGTPDLDGDGQLNFCDPDSDGDALPDPDDCAALDPEVGLCDDGDPCTYDLCDEGACHFPPATGPLCDDADLCTSGDACADGLCVGTPYDCEDDNDCTDDACDGYGGCVNADNTIPCDDGSACTVDDICADGLCQPGADLDCEDNNICTDDSCNPTSGCIHTNNSAPCGGGQQCQNGQCVSLCAPGDYATWGGTCTAFCTGMGCSSGVVFGAMHGNLCGCSCCVPSAGSTSQGPYSGGLTDCAVAQGGWIPICATTCRCAQ